MTNEVIFRKRSDWNLSHIIPTTEGLKEFFNKLINEEKATVAVGSDELGNIEVALGTDLDKDSGYLNNEYWSVNFQEGVDNLGVSSSRFLTLRDWSIIQDVYYQRDRLLGLVRDNFFSAE